MIYLNKGINFILRLFLWIFIWTFVSTLFTIFKLKDTQILIICAVGVLIVGSIIYIDPKINL
jgi:hypothetical protein